MPTSRGRKKKSRGIPMPVQATDHVDLQKHWPRAIKWTIGAAITLFGLVAGVVGIWGPPWPVDPEIHPHDTVDGSSLVLPFIVKDRSALFDMPNVTFRCGIDLVYAEDSIGQKVIFRDEAFISGIYSVTAGGPPLNYPCNAEDLLQVRADGTLSMYGSSTIDQSKLRFHPPWHVLKMCVWIGGEYKIMGRFPWRFTSILFQWPAAPNLPQWIEGPIAHEPERIPGLVPDALQCSETVRYPYTLTTGPGLQAMVFN